MKRGRNSVYEENDKILDIGKEGLEGIKNFVEFKKEEAKDAADEELYMTKQIEKRRRSKIEYNRFLSDVLQAEIDSIIFPIGWKVLIAPNEIGVVMELQSPDGRIFRSAFKSTGEGSCDLNAVHTYALRAENTLFRMKNDGIII